MSVSVCHSGSSGDIIFSLPTVLALHKKHGTINYYLRTDVPGQGYPGRNHPSGNIRLSKSYAEALIPLLSSQLGLGDVDILGDQPIDLDLDLFRLLQIDYTRGNLPRFYFYAFEAHYDLSEPWLWVNPDERFDGRVVINRTQGYLNPRLNFKFLAPYEPVFIGTPLEYELFIRECPTAKYVHTRDFLSAAKIIAASALFIGNQSACFALAEGLKVKRILETCLWCANVVPSGAGGHDVVNQLQFESVVKELLGGPG